MLVDGIADTKLCIANRELIFLTKFSILENAHCELLAVVAFLEYIGFQNEITQVRLGD